MRIFSSSLLKGPVNHGKTIDHKRVVCKIRPALGAVGYESLSKRLPSVLFWLADIQRGNELNSAPI